MPVRRVFLKRLSRYRLTKVRAKNVYNRMQSSEP